jgi:uncharacterized protein YgiM (DUF1202 family)
MKKNCWLIFGAMLSTSLLAQQVTNPPPSAPMETPAPAAPAAPSASAAPTIPAPAAPAVAPVTEAAAPAQTNAPAAKAGKKKSAKKKSDNKKVVAKKKNPAAELKTVPLVAGPAVSIAGNVNVRAQATLKSEVVTHLTKDQSVTVIEEIVRNNSGPDEPSAWAKIALPSGAHVWVNGGFIDPATKAVKPKKLNLRSGPGENFSVLGRLAQGEVVKDVTTKGDWMEIESPTNAYAFVAAQYLKQEAPGAAATAPAEVAAAKPAEPVLTNAAVAEAPAVAAAPTEVPAAPAAPAAPVVTAAPAAPIVPPPTEPPAVTNMPVEPEVAAAPVVSEPLPKRIVQHEGQVRGTVSIQAPTHFALVGDDGRLIDYLYTSSPNLDLRRYKGFRIIVTGEESLEERWPNTPIITIQKIQVLGDAGYSY